MDVNILLFSDFETLDVFGPAEILGNIGKYRLRFLSVDGGVVTSRQGVRVVTTPACEAGAGGVLLVPGGLGARALVHDEAFLCILREFALASSYCLAVCTGSALLAKTGLLDGRRATSNKKAFSWVRSVNEKVLWAACARWVVDGKFYTSSGVSAGMDMALGFVCDRFGRQAAEELAQSIEYVWNDDNEKDFFAG
ncbi:MAG: DJ-1/PfpI family protein [Oscillospiraceae bacterium]|nr:DJ-1/PfpI family protein [Oscillospiraceae bacterium]